MDIQSLLGQLLSSDSIKSLSKSSGASSSDVKKVLTQALPLLLNGADQQAKNSDTSESFTKALAQHAKDDTSDLGSFLKNIDLEDGGKIIGHLLGTEKKSATKSVSKKTGVDQNTTDTILSTIAPLLMSLLGKQTSSDKDSDFGVGDLMGVLLENVDVGSLLGSFLGGDEDEEEKPATKTTSSGKKLTKASGKSKKSGKGSDAVNLIGRLLTGLLKK